MKIKGALFDFGNTLVSIELDWVKLIPLNISSMVHYLRSQEIKVDIHSFGTRFVELKNLKHKKGQEILYEYHSLDTLRESLAEYGFNEISEPILQNALDAYFSPEISEYPLVENVYDVLKILKDKKLKLGLVSNASSGEIIYKAMKIRKLDGYFDSVIVSADIGFRKPHPKIFELALKELKLEPFETVMIGDVPAYDILGAQKKGLKTILVKYINSSEAKKNKTEVQPDSIAYHITDIPEIIDSWNK